MIARAHAASDEPLGQALLDAGCVRAIAGRGYLEQFVSRAGTADPPMSHYASTTLYAIAQPMAPRGFRFDRSPEGKPLWPVADKPVP